MTTVQMDVTRHMELFDPFNFNTPIHIIGAGATGSWLTLSLAKLGIRGELINVWDFDEVEDHNIPNQLFAIHNIGEPKVVALQGLVQTFTGAHINIHNKAYESERLRGIVFLMVDSMAERERIWKEHIKLKSTVKHLIEPRMGLDVGRIYNVNPLDVEHAKRYEATYYSDDVAEVSACGASMTVVTTAMSIASMCARQLINYHNEVELDNEILYDFMYNNIMAYKW